MAASNSQKVLKDIAKQVGGRVSSCQVYDRNICSFRVDPENPAQIISTAGQPFTRQLTYAQKNQRVRLHTNDTFLEISFPIELGIEPIAINRPNKITLMRSAGESEIGTLKYPVFSSNGVLDKAHLSLIESGSFCRFVETVNPSAEESIHLNRSGLTIYLCLPSAQRVFDLINASTVLLQQFAPKKQGIDLSSLPAQFRPLIPRIQSCGITDDAARDELRENSTRAALQAVVEEVKPYLSGIDSYLDSFGERALPEAATALGALAEFVAETELYLKDTQ